MNSGRVISSYLAIAGIFTLSASLIWGVNTLFLLDAGLDILGVFVANAFFTVGMVVFEIPTGVLADTRGRRASFLLSVAVLALGTAAYVGLAQIEAGLVWFCGASVIIGLGYTFYSGAVEAWLVDALAATGYEGELDQVFARGSMVTGTAMLVGTLAGGALGTVDLAWPFVGRIGLLVGVFFVALATMHDLGFAPRAVRLSQLPIEMRQVARDSVTYGWNRREVRLLTAVSFVQMGFLTWGFYAWQPYFLELLDSDAVWIAGVVAALVALSTIAGNGVVEWLTRFCGKRSTLMLWSAAVQTGAAVGVGLAPSFPLALGFLLVATAGMGVMGPVKQAYLHAVIPSEQRATVVSFDSMIGSTGSIGGQTGLGYLARVESISAGYVVGGLATVAAVPLLGRLRAQGRPADVIVGTAGARGPCAAQGLPEVAGVDHIRRSPASVGAD